MDEVADYGTTSTWDDWLVMRADTGNEYADGMARALQDPNFTMEVLDLSSEGNRDGLRQLFDEFETATAGQSIRGRSVMGLKRRAPDQWRVETDSVQNTVTVTFAADNAPGMFVVMNKLTGALFIRDVVEALESIDGTP